MARRNPPGSDSFLVPGTQRVPSPSRARKGPAPTPATAKDIAKWIERLGSPGTDAIICFCEEQFADLGPLYPVPLVAALGRVVVENGLGLEATVSILRTVAETYRKQSARENRAYRKASAAN